MTRAFIPPARPLIGEEEIEAVAAVMRTGMIAQGPQVAAFEEEFAAALVPGTRAVAVNSGTSALHLGLLAAGIGPGDEVIVPSFTFAATANSVAITGATPVFADIDPRTFTLSPAAVEAAITPHTRAIMPVHLYGHPAPMDALQAIADAHGLLLFEDAAQAHGATLRGRAVGSFGAFAAFSFYPTKNMTSGEGGMVTSTDPSVIRGVKLARNQGMETRYANEIVGLNNRMTDIHAAIGRVQLTKVGAWTRARQDNAAFLDAHLRGPARRARRYARVPPVHDPRGRGPRRVRRRPARGVRRRLGRLLPDPEPRAGFPGPLRPLCGAARHARGRRPGAFPADLPVPDARRVGAHRRGRQRARGSRCLT